MLMQLYSTFLIPQRLWRTVQDDTLGKAIQKNLFYL